MSTLYLLRGLPGSGKSTLAQSLLNNANIFEADMYFIGDDGQYNFDTSKLGEAHRWCQTMVAQIMAYHDNEDIVVANTFTTEKELEPYLLLANNFRYRVVSLVVENRHEGKSIHNVPDEVISKMKNRFNIKL